MASLQGFAWLLIIMTWLHFQLVKGEDEDRCDDFDNAGKALCKNFTKDTFVAKLWPGERIEFNFMLTVENINSEHKKTVFSLYLDEKNMFWINVLPQSKNLYIVHDYPLSSLQQYKAFSKGPVEISVILERLDDEVFASVPKFNMTHRMMKWEYGNYINVKINQINSSILSNLHINRFEAKEKKTLTEVSAMVSNLTQLNNAINEWTFRDDCPSRICYKANMARWQFDENNDTNPHIVSFNHISLIPDMFTLKVADDRDIIKASIHFHFRNSAKNYQLDFYNKEEGWDPRIDFFNKGDVKFRFDKDKLVAGLVFAFYLKELQDRTQVYLLYRTSSCLIGEFHTTHLESIEIQGMQRLHWLVARNRSDIEANLDESKHFYLNSIIIMITIIIIIIIACSLILIFAVWIFKQLKKIRETLAAQSDANQDKEDMAMKELDYHHYNDVEMKEDDCHHYNDLALEENEAQQNLV